MRFRLISALVLAVAFMAGSVVAAGADPPLITGEQVADDSLTGADILESSLALGWVRVQSGVVPIPINTPAFVEVECPSGTRPIGGGYELRTIEFVNFFPYEMVTVSDNMPAPNVQTQVTGWLVVVEPNGTYSGLGVRAYVICAAI